MFYKNLRTAFLLLLTQTVNAQQFIGLTPNHDYTTVQQVPYNPAWVNNAATGMEINVFGACFLGGTNGYLVSRDWLISGFNNAAVENKDYYKDLRHNKKYEWVNADVLGPAVSFNIKGIHNIGVYTRAREISRGGNIGELAFSQLGHLQEQYYNYQFQYKNVGISSNTFAEVGVTYGREIKNDLYHIWRGGVTVKYLMGFAAGSVFAGNIGYTQSTEDSLYKVSGDITGLFTYNMNPLDGTNAHFNANQLKERAGRGSLGLDLGVQYEYHSEGNINEASPYVYSIAVSITDIGSVPYIADTGSGSYQLTVHKNVIQSFDVSDNETLASYTQRLINDSLLVKTADVKKFRMGLPTALRINADYNVTTHFNLAVNMLLNMRGDNGDVYRPSYVSYFNITPTIGGKKFKVGFPFSFIGYQTVVIGITAQAGPLYFGTNSAVSTFLSKNLKNADAFIGLAFKLRKEKRNYYTY
jgi:hypothetical protein